MKTRDVLYSDDPLVVYVREVNKVPPLDAAEEAQCIHLARASDEAGEVARKRLLEANLRHVIALAELYQNDRVHILDLIQAGNGGLIAALNNLGQFSNGLFWGFASTFVAAAIAQAANRDAPE